MAFVDIGLRIYSAIDFLQEDYGSGVLVVWCDDDPGEDHPVRIHHNSQTYGLLVNNPACHEYSFRHAL
jgi:hypothetical protein